MGTMMAKMANPNVASPATGIGAPGEREGRGRRAAHDRWVRAYVGLGANLGDAAATLAAGIRALAAVRGLRLRAVSRLYATAPWGKADQPEFRNAVVALDVPAGPDDRTSAVALLTTLKSVERAFGREERERWGPRELDLDLLVFGRAHFSTERPAAARSRDLARAGLPLTVPHPEARHRLFVLAPLADLAPRLVPPGWGETVESARRRQLQAEGPEAVRPIARWQTGEWEPLREDSA
jgi:2-amino-4-hydroxy-6-hydroxymethyldihydropteridine diphosphokinase